MSCALFDFFFQAEDGIRDLVRSRGLGDVYKRQVQEDIKKFLHSFEIFANQLEVLSIMRIFNKSNSGCLLYTSDAADERSSVDLGGRRIIKKKNNKTLRGMRTRQHKIVVNNMLTKR